MTTGEQALKAAITLKRIGFIGIGNMGAPMAAHLIEAGFHVTVYDIRPEAVSIFVERHGGTVANTPEAVAEQANALITMLPHVLTRTYGTGMALGFIAKDVRIALDTGRSIEAFAPLAERVSELWSAAAEKLGPDVDQTEIARYWEEASGVKL